MRPGVPIEYRPFFPELWAAPPRMTPWVGSRVALLTLPGDYDLAVMERFVARLDQAWTLYEDLIGRPPSPLHTHEGRALITAVPSVENTGGYACGYVGLTGVEVGGFYAQDYATVRDSPGAFPHYYFYELGRNWYVFDARHSAFTTGFAVFMRYVCVDTLGCGDADAKTRDTIERAVFALEGSELGFLDAFTNAGRLDEKAPRLPRLNPSDQPVMYASAMLELWRLGGGNGWLRRFFARLHEGPSLPGEGADAALGQSLTWLVAASLAMREDLTDLFVDRWLLPLDPGVRSRLAELPWDEEGLTTAEALRRVGG